jgi:hypothetical protein
MTMYDLAIVAHIIGAVLGVGGVTIYTLQFFKSIGDSEIATAFQKSDSFYGKIILSGFFILVISGFYFMFSQPSLWGSERILTKLSLLVLLFINAQIVDAKVVPRIASLTPEDWDKKSQSLKNTVKSLLPFDAISLSGWYTVLVLGAVGNQSWNFVQILVGYAIALSLVFIALRLAANRKLENIEEGDLKPVA